MATVLVIRDEVDVVRLVNALVDSAEALAGSDVERDQNEARARMILSNRLADELDAAQDRDRGRHRLPWRVLRRHRREAASLLPAVRHPARRPTVRRPSRDRCLRRVGGSGVMIPPLDDELWQRPLGPATGVMVALAAGAVTWIVLGALAFLAWAVIR